MSSASKLLALRALMCQHNLAAFIVPTADAHQSEYVAECDKRREFVSGFTGSYGVALVTHTSALLWTDGRYYAQAELELSSDWTLMRQGRRDVPDLQSWLRTNGARLSHGKPVLASASVKVGYDPEVTDINTYRHLRQKLKNDEAMELTPVDVNLVDLVWDAARAARPCKPVFAQPLAYVGSTVAQRLAALRAAVRAREAKSNGGIAVAGVVVSALDEVAWLFNLRGSDIDYNPVFFSFAFVTHTAATLYVDATKVTESVLKHLQAQTAGDAAPLKIKPYESVYADLAALQLKRPRDGNASPHVWMDPYKTNVRAYLCIKSSDKKTNFVLEEQSPIALLKAVKNETELNGLRESHRRDGAALCRYLHWLETVDLDAGAYDEITAAAVLADFRAEQSDAMGLSFASISASGSNGAIIHYEPEPASVVGSTLARVSSRDLYLIDSGGQYRDGTTDVTRTVHPGTPTARQRRCFTRVLQGHIALAAAVFPENTCGPTLDVLARLPLWRDGLEYLHGTGHGVGSFLNVHEGPQGISSSLAKSSVTTTPLVPGMTVTNEPGYYETGEFGIRIESLLIVRAAATPNNFEGQRFFEFDTITMAPMQRRMLDRALLSADERAWIDAYHARVLSSVGPLLLADGHTVVHAWLADACRPLADDDDDDE
jgi:Xaa-Pro aminopeptidase